MQRVSKIVSIIAVGLLMGGLASPCAVMAQQGPTPRAGTWEFVLPITYASSKSFDGQGGSSAEVNSNLGFGLGFGYNVNNNFQLGGNVNWANRGFNATIVDANGAKTQASGTMNSSAINFNGTFFMSPGAIAPYVTAGIGSVWLDTNIPNGKPSTGCWYDPWLGYICSTYAPTKTGTAVSYNAGLGLRWELSRGIALQGSYNQMWLDYNSAKPSFDGWTLAIVFRN
jgi:opacity protein-like surface antigen